MTFILQKQNLLLAIARTVTLIFCGMVSVSGCNKDSATAASATATSSSSTEISEAARAEAKQIFATRCTPCHGPAGQGDGPASLGLNPKPRNFSLSDWQGTITDSKIETIIIYGGAAVGKSPAMPSNPDLDGKRDVVRALREYIRSLKR